MDKTKTTQDTDQELIEKPVKSKSKSASERRSMLDFRKYTKQIWLAGLGAFSRAEEEGNKLFDSLVKVGEELESKTVDIADQTVEKVSEKARESVTDTKDKVEKLIDNSVHHSLNRIGLVTLKDVQHLERLILQLHAKVDELTLQQEKIQKELSEKIHTK
ncbi:phasin family protein [Acinetobacter variabilis]|jgi:Poly(hydroxyalcanoate) granule associated protein (phasin).|uniref:phasin family protein n=1 Tax=Acinetobacter TaxID=469 RepID=UPI0004493461|nr:MULTISPECIES: phasin family protein [Acinetobacter]EXA67713.1 poly family protein [Acinetobacter baumannii 348935]HCL58966.1 poly(hydroxyalcanoate) granule associated protein [Acinetobacter sp.]AUX89677.1 poly(hydroxyalcanoate) granule associated protein [Acinetobacter sp. ACNIH1]MCU4630476.1 phasin family protein [Acinetobacter variabilis]UXI50263.1 phasin family protein [Acinetobacter variabilis]